MSDQDPRAGHRGQVRDFLVSRRERITPEQAGLPAYGGVNRRVKGLRREEVAMLAGVSVDYYVRMERGTLAGASAAVIDGVANALQLNDAEREHLTALARAAGPAPRRSRPATVAVRPVLRQVLDAITNAPAWVRNARERAVPPALGIERRQVPPQWTQTASSPRRRRSRTQLREHAAVLRARTAFDRLHRRPLHPHRRRTCALEQLGCQRPNRPSPP